MSADRAGALSSLLRLQGPLGFALMRFGQMALALGVLRLTFAALSGPDFIRFGYMMFMVSMASALNNGCFVRLWFDSIHAARASLWRNLSSLMLLGAVASLIAPLVSGDSHRFTLGAALFFMAYLAFRFAERILVVALFSQKRSMAAFAVTYGVSLLELVACLVVLNLPDDQRLAARFALPAVPGLIIALLFGIRLAKGKPEVSRSVQFSMPPMALSAYLALMTIAMALERFIGSALAATEALDSYLLAHSYILALIGLFTSITDWVRPRVIAAPSIAGLLPAERQGLIVIALGLMGSLIAYPIALHLKLLEPIGFAPWAFLSLGAVLFGMAGLLQIRALRENAIFAVLISWIVSIAVRGAYLGLDPSVSGLDESFLAGGAAALAAIITTALMLRDHSEAKPRKLVFFANPNSVHLRQWRTLMPAGLVARVLHAEPRVSDPAYSPRPEAMGILARGPKALRYTAAGLKARLALRGQSDILVHAHSASGYGLMALLAGKPFVVTVYGTEVYAARERGALYRLMLNAVLSRARGIATSSSAMRDHLKAHYPALANRITAFSWGVDTSLFSPETRADDARVKHAHGLTELPRPIFFVNRRLTEHYRTLEVIEGFKAYKATGGKGSLVLLKGDADTTYLGKVRAALNGLEDCRLVEAMLSAQDMAAMLRGCDVFVSVPISDQLSSAVLEGMASSRLAILPALSAYQELFDKGATAVIIEAHSPQAFARAFSQSESMGQEARTERAENARHIILGHYAHDGAREAMAAFYARHLGEGEAR